MRVFILVLVTAAPNRSAAENLFDLQKRQRTAPSHKTFSNLRLNDTTLKESVFVKGSADLHGTCDTSVYTNPAPFVRFASLRSRCGALDQLKDLLHDAQRRAGPELAMTAVCSVVFLLWQFNSLTGLMNRHFLSSAWNIRHGRLHACLLSAISHQDFRHLVFNMASLFAMSPTVRLLIGKRYPWVFLGSILVSDLFQILRHPHGSSLGLSGFLSTLLALFAEYYPDATLYFRVGDVPCKAKARQVLYSSLALSAVLAICSWDNIGHAAHFGGLLFGVLYARWPRKSRSFFV
jgi:membrane associated rhomboid family serine protease